MRAADVQALRINCISKAAVRCSSGVARYYAGVMRRSVTLISLPSNRVMAISLRTARKWRRRHEVLGQEALRDRSSRPLKTRDSLDAELSRRVEQLRRSRMPMRRIAGQVGRSVATISRVLAKLGLLCVLPISCKPMPPVDKHLAKRHPP